MPPTCLGALSPADRAAYEEHLRGLRRRAGIGAPAGRAARPARPDHGGGRRAPAGPPVPETLLPGLLTRVAAARRHRRWVLAGVLAAAVAVVVALAGTLILRTPVDTAGNVAGTTAASSSTAPTTTPVPAFLQPMTQVLASPMTASLELVDKRWGTAITVVCQYDKNVDRSVAYDLTVIDTDGHLNSAGSWSGAGCQCPGADGDRGAARTYRFLRGPAARRPDDSSRSSVTSLSDRHTVGNPRGTAGYRVPAVISGP